MACRCFMGQDVQPFLKTPTMHMMYNVSPLLFRLLLLWSVLLNTHAHTHGDIHTRTHSLSLSHTHTQTHTHTNTHTYTHSTQTGGQCTRIFQRSSSSTRRCKNCVCAELESKHHT